MTKEDKEIIRKLIAAETRIVQLEEENEKLKADREWVLCDDDMPDLNRNVLVLINDKYYDVDCLFSEGVDNIYWNNYPDGGVTHWMPLPLPPKQ